MAIVSTNLNSLLGIVSLRKTENQLTASLEKLSLGLRITKASDDPSGKGLANKFSAQVSGIHQAIENAQDASSLLETAAGALNSTSELLVRMRDLALSAMNVATLTTSDIAAMQTEFASLRDEITRSANAVSFNSRILLNGSYAAGVAAQIGPDNLAAMQLSITIQTMLASSIANATDDLANVQLTSDGTNSAAGHAASAVGALDASLDYLSTVQAAIGVQQIKLNSIINDLSSQETNTAAALSRITDVDMASEVSHFAKLQIITQAATAVIAQGETANQRVMTLINSLNR